MNTWDIRFFENFDGMKITQVPTQMTQVELDDTQMTGAPTHEPYAYPTASVALPKGFA